MLHEVGHGLYEQGLDPQHYGTPMGEAASLGMDEAQARLWENRVGRSRGFWEHFLPRASERFPEALSDVDLDEFHFAVNRVTPSLIRVHADEVTYNVHVMIRFELERALLSGDLLAEDLPGAWNDAYRTYLGVTPANDAEGCLQDGHWAEGLIGYFPTYTLGDVFAAQLFARAEQDLGDLGESFARGEFRELVRWLGERIYRQGEPVSVGAADRGGHGLAAGPPAAGGGAASAVRGAVRSLIRWAWSCMSNVRPKQQQCIFYAVKFLGR